MTRTKTLKRKRIFVGSGFQLRYTGLVVGSLLVILVFAAVQPIFMAQQALGPDAWAAIREPLRESTIRLALVGLIYIIVMGLAAIFLSHRLVGPTHRIEEDINKMVNGDAPLEPLHVREGDEFEGLVQSINKLIRKKQGN